jgi:hypothetical protein
MDAQERQYRFMLQLLHQAKFIQHEDQEVSQYEHALLTATYAVEAQAPEDIVLTALLHDLSKPANEIFHGQVMAWMLHGKVSTDAITICHWHGHFAKALERHEPALAPGAFPERLLPLAAQFAEWDLKALFLAPHRPWYDFKPLFDHYFLPKAPSWRQEVA